MLGLVLQVYFKCNRNFINQMPNLKNYVRELYSIPGIQRAVNMYHVKVRLAIVSPSRDHVCLPGMHGTFPLHYFLPHSPAQLKQGFACMLGQFVGVAFCPHMQSA